MCILIQSISIPVATFHNIKLSSKTTFEPCETPEYAYSTLNDQFNSSNIINRSWKKSDSPVIIARIPMKNILKTFYGSIGILLLFCSAILLYFFIVYDRSTIYELLVAIVFFLIGSLFFGLSAGAFRKPLFFSIPLSIILSFFLLPELLPKSMIGMKFENGLLIILLISLTVSYVVRRYYSIKESKSNTSLTQPNPK